MEFPRIAESELGRTGAARKDWGDRVYPKEDLSLAVKRVHHEVQQLLDFRLKRESRRLAVRHGRPERFFGMRG